MYTCIAANFPMNKINVKQHVFFPNPQFSHGKGVCNAFCLSNFILRSSQHKPTAGCDTFNQHNIYFIKLILKLFITLLQLLHCGRYIPVICQFSGYLGIPVHRETNRMKISCDFDKEIHKSWLHAQLWSFVDDQIAKGVLQVSYNMQ